MRRLAIVGLVLAMASASCGEDSKPTAATPSGACCLTDATCVVTIEANCPGSWTEVGVCMPNPCTQSPPPTGSCCAGDGSCSLTTLAACPETWTVASACPPNPCTPPSGACCLMDGTCRVKTQDACTGAWNELGTCEPNLCPEPPQPGDQVPWIDPSTPAKALFNVMVTFRAKSVANYDRSLASDFTFVPAAADADLLRAEDPTYFDGWTKQREVAAFTSVFQSQGVVTFTWGPPIPPFEDMVLDPAGAGGNYYENLKYQMVFRRSGVDTTFSGLVDLYLREHPGGWSIYKWVDRQDGLGNATLGLVRWRRRVVY